MKSRVRLAVAVVAVLSCAWISAHAADAPGVSPKWEEAIKAFEKQDKEKAPPKDPVLLVGSSSFTKWKSADKDLAPLPVVNRGFGGSDMAAVLAYYERLVLPYHPKTVVLYEGGNDINSGTKPEKVLEEIKTFVTKVNKDLPETQIVILSVHLAPSRAKYIDRYKELNRIVAEFGKDAKNVTVVDATTALLKDGQPDPDIYGSDRLHLNAEGNKRWCAIFKPVLEKVHGLKEAEKK